jgi:hypothetical protein
MVYTLLRGEFVIRYADLPRQGPEPDGDTVKFRPDTPALVEVLPKRSGVPADIGPRGVSIRLEAIDALETHFEETHQELGMARAARDELLRILGFTNVTFFPDLPNKVQSADHDSLRGYVLSNGIDANGRVIGFVYPGDPAAPDGASVFLDGPLVDQSANAQLLTKGLVYPAYYGTLPVDLRTHLAVTSTGARDDLRGLWPESTADPNGAAHVTGMTQLQTLAMWPKLFRRVVSYLSGGASSFDGFDAWLRADAVHRDDALFLLTRGEPGNLHDVVLASGDSIQLTMWPEDFIIEPDPGGEPGPKPMQAGDVVIVAALPNPEGADVGHELVTLINTTAGDIDLHGWSLGDQAGGRQSLTGVVGAGRAHEVPLGGAVRLGNDGDSILLVDATGGTVDRVSYTGKQAQSGRTICFGR